MKNERHILIVSTTADIATDDVVRRLSSRGLQFYRLNSESLPFSRTLSYRVGTNSQRWEAEFDGKAISNPISIWYRRLRTPSKPAEMDPGIYDFCLRESRAALVGKLLGLKSRWMSHPGAIWQAEFKPYQLSAALRVGLSVPRSVVTNDPNAIRKAFTEFGSMVAKPVSSGYVVHEGREYSIFTSRVLEDHLEELESARCSPAIYQELVAKKFDLRITIVGRRIFAAAIDSQSDVMATVDWRKTTNPRLPHHVIQLPDPISAGLLRLMDALGLNFGAIDMIETADGEYIFLEVNPSGQWLWLQDMLGLGISDAIADWLAGEEIT